MATQIRGLRKIMEPGRFEGELVISQWLHEKTLEGWTEEEAGDVIELGWWAGLVRGPIEPSEEDKQKYSFTQAELQFLRRAAGAIVTEEQAGFVTVIWYVKGQKRQLEKEWKEILRQEEEAYTEY